MHLMFTKSMNLVIIKNLSNPRSLNPVMSFLSPVHKSPSNSKVSATKRVSSLSISLHNWSAPLMVSHVGRTHYALSDLRDFIA